MRSGVADRTSGLVVFVLELVLVVACPAPPTAFAQRGAASARSPLGGPALAAGSCGKYPPIADACGRRASA